MRLTVHIARSLAFHWRRHLPVALGVMTATATLTGALLVGDSMRASLREAALDGLGNVDHAIVAGRFFGEGIAAGLTRSAAFSNRFSNACPLIILRGGVEHPDTGGRVGRVAVYGVTEGFWELADPSLGPKPVAPVSNRWSTQATNLGRAGGDGTGSDSGSRSVILNETLARELGVSRGADVLVRVGKPNPIPTETLLGRRDETRLTLRLTVHSIIPADGAGGFELKPRRSPPLNAWIPLPTLQRALKQFGRVNTILITERAVAQVCDLGAPPVENRCHRGPELQRMLQELLTLEDVGLRLRIDSARGYIALESESLLIEPAVERAALQSAAPAGAIASPVLTYLANTISVGPRNASPSSSPPPIGDHRAAPIPQSTIHNPQPAIRNPQSAFRIPQSIIPYSTIAAIDPSVAGALPLHLTDGSAEGSLKPGGILLTQWAADDLQVEPGEAINLSYYVTGPFGRLETRDHSFVLGGVVSMDGGDPGFTPVYPGVTDAENLADWDPPFPIDFDLIREKDEAYWDDYGAAPKAFIALDDGRRLWSSGLERFGQSTSIRIVPQAGGDLSAVASAFRDQLRKRLDLTQLGFSFEPVRERAVTASAGSTDFGMLFVSFSFFLIASAAMLVALLFRLGTERRANEVGILRAMGFPHKRVTRLLLAEGAVIAGAGAGVGLVVAMGYAWLMLAGLKTCWSDAVSVPFLRLHTPVSTLITGFAASVIIALASIAWSIRSLRRVWARSLLAGVIEIESQTARRRKAGLTIAVGAAALILAGVLLAAALSPGPSPFSEDHLCPPTVAFFGGGTALLIAALCACKTWLDTNRRTTIGGSGIGAFARLGLSNAARHPGRSLLTIGLIASATFIISAIEALRLDVDAGSTNRSSPTGGFALLAESAIPLPYDLNTPEGREALGVGESASDTLDDVTIIPFRLRPGDETSCRDPYRPTTPRIIGATDAMINRGGFGFASTLTLQGGETPAGGENPWTLLNHTFPGGAVPVIGDESAVKWQLHLGLGEDLTITDERGREVRLRFVALLAGSALQDELIVAESRFVELFPSISGHAFFLIDVPHVSGIDISGTGILPVEGRALERALAAYALDVEPTAKRLAEYLAVQNTYLSTFQTLGGLGLILGALGLAVVLLRNVWERRSELALMRALGFSRAALATVVLAENVVLVVAGLIAGTVPALVAVTPHILQRGGELPWLSLGITIGSVFAAGVGAGALALVGTLQAPLLPALRRE